MKSKLGLQWGEHKQATAVCKQLFSFIKKGEKRFVVLMPMQSGKTSVVQCIAERMGVEGPHRIIYLCSYDRVSYKNQIQNDLRVFEKEECLTLVGKDILKYKPQPNDIVLVDEAGYGVSEDQRLDRALTAVDAVVVAISATPYEAMKSSWNGRVLSPSRKSLEKYYGIWDMLQAGKVKKAYECISIKQKKKPELTPWFQNIIDNMPAKSYGIVRVRNRDEADILQKLLARQYIRSDVWAQGSPLSADIKDLLGTMPRRKKIFIVVNHLRMGERITDNYLHFVIERLPKQRSMNNTIAQSLIGRCCGWDKKPAKVNVYTDVTEAQAYARMWKDVWSKKEVSMMKKGNATKNFSGSFQRREAANATAKIVSSFKELPAAVRNNIKYGVIKSRTQKHSDMKSYLANNTKGNKVVETKSYFGRGKVSERNRIDLVAALKAIEQNNGLVTNFTQFAKRHSGQQQLSDYALFCIQTDELYEQYGVRSGEFILLTRQSEKYNLEENTVQLKECLFTTLAKGTANGIHEQR